MSRNFMADITCAGCGSMIYNRVRIPGTKQQAGMNADMPAELEAEGDRYYFQCENCGAKNEVSVTPMDDGTGSRINPTGNLL